MSGSKRERLAKYSEKCLCEGACPTGGPSSRCSNFQFLHALRHIFLVFNHPQYYIYILTTPHPQKEMIIIYVENMETLYKETDYESLL